MYFRRKKRIAAGSFGEARLCDVTDFGKTLLKTSTKEPLPSQVVVKEMIGFSDGVVEEMVNEVSLLRKISHSTLNVIPKYYGCLVDKTVHLVMEYIEGKDLIDFLEEYSESKEIENLFQYCLREGVPALKQLHDHRVVHGDIIPENITAAKPSTV